MKIVQETPSLLILKQRNIFSIILGVTFLVVGIYGFFFLKSTGINSFIVFLAFIFFGPLVVVLTKFQTIIIDKTVNKFSFISTGLLGKKAQEIDLNKIQEVTIEEYVTTTRSSQSGRSGSVRNYNLVFYLKDGQSTSVNINTPTIFGINSADVFSGRNKIINLGNKVAGFIGVPFKNIRPPMLSETLSTIADTVKDSINQHQPLPETSIPPPVQEPINKV